MQNCLPLADMRHGTTSTVRQMAHPDSGVAAAKLQTTENKDSQRLKPNIFLLN
jgi:hypothetical protein